MQNPIKYAIFPTKWGYFGISGREKGLLRTCLPRPEYEEIRSCLLRDLPGARLETALLRAAQHKIRAYFEAHPTEFGPEIPIDLAGLTRFQTAVLTACRQVRFGRTVTYGQLAEKVHRPNASRAVGSALARNPLPLIIPCHRVLAANNKLGGFSAPGGTALKARMLAHEQATARRHSHRRKSHSPFAPTQPAGTLRQKSHY